MILLIGNGPSADTPAVAEAMTKASRVLRMNNWQPGRYTGDRCDIWGTSFNVDVAIRPAPRVWWTGWPYGTPGHDDYRKVLASQRNHYDHVATKTLIARAFAATTRHPSTGIVLALMAARVSQVMLAGFDHFSKEVRHHYWNDDPAICDPLLHHDPDSERLILSMIRGCP